MKVLRFVGPRANYAGLKLSLRIRTCMIKALRYALVDLRRNRGGERIVAIWTLTGGKVLYPLERRGWSLRPYILRVGFLREDVQ